METRSLPHTVVLWLVSISVVIYERYRISYTPSTFFPLRSKPDTPIYIYIILFFYIFDRSHWLSSFLCHRASPLFFWPFYFSQELNAFSGRYWQSVATVLLSSWISQTDFYFLTKIKFTALNEILLIFLLKRLPPSEFFSLLAFSCFPQHDNCENPSLSNKPPSHSGLNDHLLYHFR